jgi:hypothetical protein
MKLLEICHLDVDGSVISEQKNLLNILHQDGEEYLLRAAFMGGKVSDVIPDNYYLGLDNRQSIAADQTMNDLIGEPFGNGYERQPIASFGDFAINFEQDHFIATSPIVAFRATTGSWGPASNLWLTDTSDNSGYLISTIVLNSPVSLSSGQAITMRIGMQLLQC